MKKILPLSLLALSAAYMSAANPVSASLEVNSDNLKVCAINDANSFSVKAGESRADSWSEEVTGEMTDNIYSPTLSLQALTYNVGVKKNFSNNHFEIIDPWRGLFDQIGGAGVQSPSMEIDASDPTNCVIDYTPTGVGPGAGASSYELVSYNVYLGDDDATKITLTEDGGNSVFTFPVHSMLLFDPNDGSYYWACKSEVSTITFPTIQQDNSSIGDIIVDAEAEVEYFNLQGIRIENPKAGQIVIKRQGNVVSKEFIR